VQINVHLCILAIVLVFDSVDPSLVLYCDIGILDMNSKSPYGLITRHITNMYPTINFANLRASSITENRVGEVDCEILTLSF
jgi:hypothetical protein